MNLGFPCRNNNKCIFELTYKLEINILHVLLISMAHLNAKCILIVNEMSLLLIGNYIEYFCQIHKMCHTLLVH